MEDDLLIANVLLSQFRGGNLWLGRQAKKQNVYHKNKRYETTDSNTMDTPYCMDSDNRLFSPNRRWNGFRFCRCIISRILPHTNGYSDSMYGCNIFLYHFNSWSNHFLN